MSKELELKLPAKAEKPPENKVTVNSEKTDSKPNYPLTFRAEQTRMFYQMPLNGGPKE